MEQRWKKKLKPTISAICLKGGGRLLTSIFHTYTNIESSLILKQFNF